MAARVHAHTLWESLAPLRPSTLNVGEGKREAWNDSWHDGSRSSTAWAVSYQHFSAWLWTSEAVESGGEGWDLQWFPPAAGCQVSARTAEVTDTSPQHRLTRGNADVWKRANSGCRSPCLHGNLTHCPVQSIAYMGVSIFLSATLTTLKVLFDLHHWTVGLFLGAVGASFCRT